MKFERNWKALISYMYTRLKYRWSMYRTYVYKRSYFSIFEYNSRLPDSEIFKSSRFPNTIFKCRGTYSCREYTQIFVIKHLQFTERPFLDERLENFAYFYLIAFRKIGFRQLAYIWILQQITFRVSINYKITLFIFTTPITLRYIR